MNPALAVIGCGYWGKNLVRVFSELGALRCVCDTNPQRYEALKFAGPRPPFTETSRQVLSDAQLPAVAIATPAATHYELVRRALEAGKDVFVEKPLALNSRQGQELVALAEGRGAVLMVGHILLYHPAVVKLRQLIQQGALGRILYCYSNRLNMGLIRTEENILWSFAPHDISVILHLLGEEPIAAEADGQSYLTPGVVDVTLSRLKFKSGVTANLRQLAAPSKEQRLVIVGTEKMAVFDDTAAKKLLLYPHHVDWISAAPKAVKAEPVAVELDKAEPSRGMPALPRLRCRAENAALRRPRGPPRAAGAGRLPAVVGATAAAVRRRDAAAKPRYFAHPSAYVDQPCSIGKGTEDLAFFARHEGGRHGTRTARSAKTWSSAAAAVIGNGVKIQNNVSVYDAVTLEDGVFCGPSMVFTNVLNPRSEIVRKNEYRPTLVRQGPPWEPTARSSAGIPWAATPSWRPAPWWPATWPTSPSWRACQPGRSAGCAAVRPRHLEFRDGAPAMRRLRQAISPPRGPGGRGGRGGNPPSLKREIPVRSGSLS